MSNIAALDRHHVKKPPSAPEQRLLVPDRSKMSLCERVRPYAMWAGGLSIVAACAFIGKMLLAGSVLGPIGAAIGFSAGLVLLGLLQLLAALYGRSSNNPPVEKERVFNVEKEHAFKLIEDTIDFCARCPTSNLKQNAVNRCLASVLGPRSKFTPEVRYAVIDFLHYYDTHLKDTDLGNEIGGYFDKYLDENLPVSVAVTTSALPPQPRSPFSFDCDDGESVMSKLDESNGVGMKSDDSAEIMNKPSTDAQDDVAGSDLDPDLSAGRPAETYQSKPEDETELRGWQLIAQAVECCSTCVPAPPELKAKAVAALVDKIIAQAPSYSIAEKEQIVDCLQKYVVGKPFSHCFARCFVWLRDQHP